MKKIVGLFIILCMTFSLTGCGSKKYAFKCTGEINDINSTVLGIAKDGEVTKIIIKEAAEASSSKEAKIGAKTIESIYSVATPQGATLTAKASGKKINITINIDVEEIAQSIANETYDENNAIQFTSEFDFSDVSIDAFINFLERKGLTCE